MIQMRISKHIVAPLDVLEISISICWILDKTKGPKLQKVDKTITILKVVFKPAQNERVLKVGFSSTINKSLRFSIKIR